MSRRSDQDQKYHNRGQEDAAKGYGNYEPPHGLIKSIVDNDADADNKAYRDGYREGASKR
jgi:hypothetical protein